MERTSLRWAPAIGIAIASSACSLLADPDALSQGSPLAACSGDACRDAAAASAEPPASDDDSDADASPPAVSDAEKKGDAGPPFSCAAIMPAPVLCADFEGPSYVAGFGKQMNPAGNLGVDGKTLFSAVTKGQTDEPYAYVQQLFTGSKTSVHVYFDMYVEKFVAGKDSTPFIIRMAPDTAQRHSLTIPWNSTVYQLQESYVANGTAKYQYHALPAGSLDAKKWHHIDLKLAIKATSTVTVGIDDKIVVKDAALKAPGWAAAPVEFVLGLAYVEDVSADWRVRYDNVVLDAK